MKLQKLIKNIDNIKIYSKLKESNIEIKNIVFDSRAVKDGSLFVAISGTNTDGHRHILDAINNGANTILIEKNKLKPALKLIPGELKKKIQILVTNNSRVALAELAKAFYNYACDKLKFTGITGTNGKTTTSYLVENILKKAGFLVGVLGTVNYRTHKKTVTADNTTPDPIRLQSYFSQMYNEGVSQVVMEVSSHSLHQNRVGGIRFDNAIFTNLTQDHLDYHRNMQDYFIAKSKLFTSLDEYSNAIINIDDQYGKRLLKMVRSNILSYGVNKKADVRANNIAIGEDGLSFSVSTPLGDAKIKSSLIGMYNLYNILAAIAVGISYGIDLEAISQAVMEVRNVPGRLQLVSLSSPIKVFVDYAHTDDAIKNVLSSLRKVFTSKIIIVFGCGGDRDKKKRSKMGKVAEALADWVILTSDNPRSENAQNIVADIRKGMKKSNHEIELDREKAIEKAILLAKEGDVVLIAGKGHETYQIFKDRVIPFNDKEIAEKVLEACHQPCMV